MRSKTIFFIGIFYSDPFLESFPIWKTWKMFEIAKIFLQSTTCACGQLESEAYRRCRYSKWRTSFSNHFYDKSNSSPHPNDRVVQISRDGQHVGIFKQFRNVFTLSIVRARLNCETFFSCPYFMCIPPHGLIKIYLLLVKIKYFLLEPILLELQFTCLFHWLMVQSVF